MKHLYYPSLNGLRALSILLVVVCHLSQKYHIFGYAGEKHRLIEFEPFFSNGGGIGVDIFFVISGFLITSLMLREERVANTISLKKFYVRRVLRIFPAYYAVLLVYFVLQSAGYIHITRSSWITALTYTKYLNWGLDWFTAHFWSLSVEEQFYVFWPLVFLLGDKPRKAVALTLVVAVPFVKLICFNNRVEWINPLTIFERIDAIAIGCLCAMCETRIVKVLHRHWRGYFYTAICVLFLTCTFEWWMRLHWGWFFEMFCKPYDSIANLAIAIIMMYSVFGQRGTWFRLLNTKAMNFIGILSYSIYLWQQLFIVDTTYWCNRFPVNLIYILIAALISRYFIEKPFLRISRRFR